MPSFWGIEADGPFTTIYGGGRTIDHVTGGRGKGQTLITGASRCAPLAGPFSAELAGPDFAKLLVVGWVPGGIALGISVAGLHDDLPTISSGPWGTGNAEVPAYTDLIVQVRQDARNRLEQAVRGLGADGVVGSAMTLHVRSSACRAHGRHGPFRRGGHCRDCRGAIRRPTQEGPGTEPCHPVTRLEWCESGALTAGAPGFAVARDL